MRTKFPISITEEKNVHYCASSDEFSDYVALHLATSEKLHSCVLTIKDDIDETIKIAIRSSLESDTFKIFGVAKIKKINDDEYRIYCEKYIITRLVEKICSKILEPQMEWYCPYENIVFGAFLRHAKEQYSPKVFNYILKECILDTHSVFEESGIEYLETILLQGGIYSLITDRVLIDIAKCDSSISFLNRHKNSKFANKLPTEDDLLPIINCYNFTDIEEYAYSVKSDIDKFLIATDGFNQCFFYKRDYYSSVCVNDCRVYIYGCDDSSYSYYAKSKQEAVHMANLLKRVSPVITLPHLEKLKFTFTN